MKRIYIEPDLNAPEAAEISQRLLRVYDGTVDVVTKAVALRALGAILPHGPSQAPEIIERLETVVAGPGPPEMLHPDTGIFALLTACHAGARILRRLADEDAVRRRYYGTKVYLQKLVDGGITDEMLETRHVAPCPDPRQTRPR